MGKIIELEEKINQLGNTLKEKDGQIEDLNFQITDKNTQITQLNNDIEKLNSQITENNSEISQLTNDRNTLQQGSDAKEEEIKDLKSKVKEQDARRFSKSFKDEKEELGKEKKYWQNLSILSAILGIGITFIVVFSSFNLEIEDKFSLFLIEGLTISVIIYVFKQFSYYSQHYTDALRREALAQGYQNILEGGEDGIIEEDYKKKLLDVLCKNEVKDNNYIFPQEKFFDKLIEVIDILKPKS